jgi:hypothetical protein
MLRSDPAVLHLAVAGALPSMATSRPPLLVQCMLGKCGGQVFRCVTDTSCKAALDCLGACEFNDQVSDERSCRVAGSRRSIGSLQYMPLVWLISRTRYLLPAAYRPQHLCWQAWPAARREPG